MENIVDRKQQGIEKNIFWGDYPMIGVTKDGKIRRSSRPMIRYYSSWEDYREKMILTGKEAEIQGDIGSILASREYR